MTHAHRQPGNTAKASATTTTTTTRTHARLQTHTREGEGDGIGVGGRWLPRRLQKETSEPWWWLRGVVSVKVP
jgi:hypothetical protein